MIFDRYIHGKSPAHVEIKEEFDSSAGSHDPTKLYPSGYSASYLESERSMPNNLDTIEYLLLEEEGFEKKTSRRAGDDVILQGSSHVRKKRRSRSRHRKRDKSSDQVDKEIHTKVSRSTPNEDLLLYSGNKIVPRSDQSSEIDDTSTRKRKRRKKIRRRKPEF